MPQEYKMQEALKMAIQAKKNLMDFYLKAAEVTQHPEGKKVFSRLAGEVRENVGRFFDHYNRKDLGNFEEFISAPPRPDSVMLVELEKALNADTHDRKARELALKEEEDLERHFRTAATSVVDPAVRDVFLAVAKETRNHYDVIESEYARTMGMVHETDIDTYVRE